MKIGKITLVITGSSGFLGEKLVSAAIQKGYEE
jgi:nucleoside-diphosphate-sugar epimerase